MTKTQKPAHYRIEVDGRIHNRWADWFTGMQITYTASENNPRTVLEGPVSDQSALRGMLIKLWDLNYTLVSVHMIDKVNHKEC